MGDLKNDIEKYLRGELSSAERNALERKALDDPFLADALEGAAAIGIEDFSSDLKSLQASLQNRMEESQTKVVPMWKWTLRIAAGLMIIAVGSFVLWQFTQSPEQPNRDLLSENKQKQEPVENNSSPETLDSTSAREEAAASKPTQSHTYSLSDASFDTFHYSTKRNSSGADVVEMEKPVTQSREEDQMIALQKDLASAAPSEQVVTDSVLTLEPKPVDAITGRMAGVQISQAPTSPSKEMAASETKKAKREGIESEDVALSYSNSNAKISDDRKADSPSRMVIRGASSAPANSENLFIITGKVTDAEDGDGLPGVNVLVKGTNHGTVTDGEGNYRLTVDELNPSLLFTFVGMESKEVKVEDARQVDVAMTNDMTQLSEIVVVGYGAEQVEEDPGRMEWSTPVGGRAEFKKYLETSLRYPQQALANHIEGKVTVQFTVATSGDLSEFKVVRGIGYGCDEEVMRLIKNGPKWNPTRRGGEPVAGKMRVKVRFRLPK